MNGKVFLIGAGPGDAGLLSRKGYDILTSAEVVVYDRLIGDDILAMMPKAAELINVGKNSGNHPVPQERISDILLEKALEGKRVVRLKGGDCFLFGRGGEELELLTANNIPIEVVPGIPSPIAATAYAGIPVTHRDFCSSVHFITGHKKKDGALNLDFDALIRLNGTLVFLMSVSNCDEIARGLLDNGMRPDMPCAVIENGTRPEQRKFVSTLASLTDTVRANHVISPALIVVGEVCTLSDRFDWFDTLPLHGVKILITSPEGSGSRLQAKLAALGAKAVSLPSIETRPLPFVLPDFEGVKLVSFTSIAGVRYFFEGLFASGRDCRSLGSAKIAAVGEATAAALMKYGIRADIIPGSYSGKALAAAILENGIRAGDKALLIRPVQAAPGLSEGLIAAGIDVCEQAVYETVSLPLGDIDPTAYSWTAFTSASCVKSFYASCTESGFTDFSAVRALCIGEKTAAEARKLGMETHVSEKAVLDSMVNYILEASK